MRRVPTLVNELQKFIGQKISQEMLIGRGYCNIQNGKIVNDSFPRLSELSWEETNEEVDDDEITCAKVKEYIANEVQYSHIDINDDSSYWMKGIPAEPEDVGNQEVYMVVCVGTKPTETGLKITNIMILARMVEQMGGGWFTIPGAATLESRFFEMQMVPPELIQEIELLVAGRYIPNDFTFIGKPMPENKDMFHPNPAYSLAKNSGWRNVYWHLSIEVDDDDIIKDFELSTYEREASMFQRPHCMSDDTTEAFDAALLIADQYSDEEWQKIIG